MLQKDNFWKYVSTSLNLLTFCNILYNGNMFFCVLYHYYSSLDSRNFGSLATLFFLLVHIICMAILGGWWPDRLPTRRLNKLIAATQCTFYIAARNRVKAPPHLLFYSSLECRKWQKNQLFSQNVLLASIAAHSKGTMTRDFLLQVFFMNHLPQSPWK